jgi:prepilin-type N-terminal cleavage/methylation domain-containing protein/prepilin-type processing-associated H-X9-DG protein
MRRVKGFTLIELLVVIAIIALLLAILVPTLHRVRKQTKAVVCQSNLREWGTIWAAFTSENDGYFRPRDELWEEKGDSTYRHWVWDGPYWSGDRPRYIQGIRCCPMATEPASEAGFPYGIGGTFLAWGERAKGTDKWDDYGSYGMNAWICYHYRLEQAQQLWIREQARQYWITTDVIGTSNIPVYLDSSLWFNLVLHVDPPPERDAIPQAPSIVGPCWDHTCINRHNGYINCLFMDWSVRKVGLKELWTLKWHREFDTAGPWTRAGGVKPEDWPEWMRGFKDY